MRHLSDHAELFQSITQRVLNDMFGLESLERSEVVETNSVVTDKSFIVSIYFTGMVYGEYMLALDEATAARILGLETLEGLEDRDELRDQISDAFSEALNVVVGEALVQLQSTYAKLTLTPPRVYFGEIRYPKFRTARATLRSAGGEIECHFCLDLMRLDLATSYDEALTSLLQVNSKLKEANEHLAEQQAQLVHSEKMASIGMLASGVAHEINNPLFFVDANLKTLNDYMTIIDSMISLYERLCESVKTTDNELESAVAEVRAVREDQDLDFVLQDTQHLVTETRDGVAKIKMIVKGLKEFSHVDVGGATEADLNSIIENALGLVTHRLQDHCRIETDCQPLPKVVCHTGEIGQVLINMLLNASQAIEECGRISLKSFATESEVVLVIEDNGRGICPTNLDRIFDPFFTTRPIGEGVGLGLSISYGIIRKHNGSISVESELGSGTKFTVRLPLSCAIPVCRIPQESSFPTAMN